MICQIVFRVDVLGLNVPTILEGMGIQWTWTGEVSLDQLAVAEEEEKSHGFSLMVISHANCLTLLRFPMIFIRWFSIYFQLFMGLTVNVWGVKDVNDLPIFVANEEHSSHGLELLQVRLGRGPQTKLCRGPHQALKNGWYGWLPKQNWTVFNMYFKKTNFWRYELRAKVDACFLLLKTNADTELLPKSRFEELCFQFWWFD